MPQLAFDVLARDRASKVFDQVAAKSSKTEQNLSKVGSTSGSVFGKMTAAVGGLAAGWQVWDKVMVGGFNRLANLDDARKRLDQMGISTSDAAMLMDGLKSTVEGTAFSLDAGAGAMTGFVSAGVDLDDVNSRLQMTADTAAFAQAPLDEIGNIFVKIQSQGRLTAEELNMLQERGVPALVLLADAAGVTAEAMRDMISKGQIDAEKFFQLWEKGSKGFGENNIKIEGAAKSMGDTIRGSLANAETALARVGAELVQRFIPTIDALADGTKSAADQIISAGNALDDFNAKTEETIEKILPGAREKKGLFGISEQDWNTFTLGAYGVVSSMQDLKNEAFEGGDAVGEFEGGISRFDSSAWNAKDAGEELATATGEAAEQFDAAAVAAEEAATAIDGYQSALKAATDPVFALHRAVSNLESAQQGSKDAAQNLKRAQEDLNELRKDSDSSTRDLEDAERKVADAQRAVTDSGWAVAEALAGIEAAAVNGDLSFSEFSSKLDEWVASGEITAKQADNIRERVTELTGTAEDYSGEYVADLLAETNEGKLRKAQRELDAVARTRSPRYRAELDRQAEIRAKNRLDGVANTRRARINADANTRYAEMELNYAARPRSTTISVNVRTYGALEFHQGGVIGGGLRRAHNGFKLRSDERVVIGQTGERILSRRQTAAFDELVSSMGQRSSLFSGRSSTGGAAAGVTVQLVNRGVIGSQGELERWLAESVNRLRRTGRLN